MAVATKSREAAKGSTPARRRETKAERADRNMGELLQELRVALPGVQILFAFLLTVPFAQGFTKLDGAQRELYFGVLMATALSTALLIAPTAYHRLLFRQRDKEHLVQISNRLAIAGLFVLAVAITGTVLLIADFLFQGAQVVIITVAAGLVFVVLWGVLPLLRRAELKETER
jgi:high-affinity Fe2+/Pb2+ permease